jgi:hypothetical protein
MTTRYDIAAALAVTTAHLADAIDDQRPDCAQTAATARAMLDLLAPPAVPDGLDVTAIIARAITAPWFTIRTAALCPGQFGHLVVEPAADCWRDPDEPPAELRGFLNASRHDVLALAAENRRLREALHTARTAAVTADGWDCVNCGTAYFGQVPGDGLCLACQPAPDRNRWL